MYVCHMHTVPSELEEGIRTLGTGVTDGCELSYGCQDWYSGSLNHRAISPDCPLPLEAGPVTEVGLMASHRDLSVSKNKMLGFKVCATKPGLLLF